MVFKTTPAKDLIRDVYDKQIVHKCSQEHGCKLSYFGLPGALILDIISWKEHLRLFTAIERDEDLLRHRLITSAFKHGIDDRLQLLSGDIDDVMLHWKDSNGKAPSLPAYDILNLDYEGGIVYKDLLGNSKRMSAIKKMIERQEKERTGFLLFMTVNTRNKDYNEFDNVLKDIEDQLLEYNIPATEVINWYESQGYAYKLKVYVPYVFDSIAATNRFIANYHPPVTYLGASSRRMVHFAMEMQYDETRAGRSRSRSLISILDLPFKEIRKNEFVDIPVRTIAAIT
jgi:hypothetical protein